VPNTHLLESCLRGNKLVDSQANQGTSANQTKKPVLTNIWCTNVKTVFKKLFRKPAVILKIIPKVTNYIYEYILADISSIQ
jgi:hypothetical protein